VDIGLISAPPFGPKVGPRGSYRRRTTDFIHACRKDTVTIPKEVRDLLGLHAGDRVDFVIAADGTAHLAPVTRDVTALRGLLRRPGQRKLSVADMDAAIRKRFARP
jgi:AbrB family looped-hinge helix DNA binding protein